MIKYNLNIGDVAVSRVNATYTCFGLGSCLGVFIQDRLTGISGGAHILLPESEGEENCSGKFYSVEKAVNRLLQQFEQLGSNLTYLRAKITGGANVVGLSVDNGSMNTQAVVKQLTTNKIFIAVLEVGGKQSRTAHFTSDTGLLTVKKPQINELRVY